MCLRHSSELWHTVVSLSCHSARGGLRLHAATEYCVLGAPCNHATILNAGSCCKQNGAACYCGARTG